MKPQFLPLFVALSLALTLVGCTPAQAPKNKTTLISASGIATSGGTPAEKSEAYATAAEALLTANGFSQAYDLAGLALKEDPENLRASLIDAFVGIIITQKGILARIRPLAATHPKLLKSYEKMKLETQQDTGNLMSSFSFDGPADIKTEAQLQHQIDLTSEAFTKLRKLVQARKDSEITVKANAFIVHDLPSRYANSCEIKESATLEYELICPPAATRYDITLNRADFETISYLASFYEMYFSVFNAYDMTSSIQAMAELESAVNGSPQSALDNLLKNKDFGKLRSSANLPAVQNIGLDLVGGLNWAIKNQSTICPKVYSDPSNRVGKLLNSGLCVHPMLQPMIDSLKVIFSGGVSDAKYDNNGTDYRTQIVGMALITNPLQDLRQLGDLRLNPCGNLIGIDDKSLHGFFPRGDANTVLQMTAQKCEK